MRKRNPDADEQGMALVVAILVLLVMTLLGIVLMQSTTMNRQVAGESMLSREALDNANAGVSEAIMRLRNGDAGMSTANPMATAQIFLAATGSIPVVGADTVAMATAQPNGSWLAYSTATKGPSVLTISYKTNAARDTIFRYDPARSPAVNVVSGLPIIRITSTGRAGNAATTVITEVVETPVVANVKGAMCAGLDVSYVGTADVCGRNHSANTPAGTGVPACDGYLTGSGDMPATWSTGAVSLGGASTNSDAGSAPHYLANQAGFYSGPWELLGMSQSDFITFLGTRTTSPASLNGITYIDNDAVLGNNSSSAAFHNSTGEGFLYVDGDLTLNAGFTYTGLIYVNGDLKLNGHAWILGGMVVKGTTSIKVNGTSTILYSSDAITQKLSQYSGQYTTLSWREK
jgi:Tfp pilus assembly protein PilX